MSNVVIAIDVGLAILEYMQRRNLNTMQFNEKLRKMRAEGKETFTLDELQARQDELKSEIDKF